MTPEREQQLLDEIAALKRENELLRQKLDLVLRKLFGKSSEALDPAQARTPPPSWRSGDRQQSHRKRHPPHRHRQKELVLCVTKGGQ
jgi:hypothetical protein